MSTSFKIFSISSIFLLTKHKITKKKKKTRSIDKKKKKKEKEKEKSKKRDKQRKRGLTGVDGNVGGSAWLDQQRNKDKKKSCAGVKKEERKRGKKKNKKEKEGRVRGATYREERKKLRKAQKE